MIKYRRKNQQENGVDEIDGCNGDVESVGLLIHPRPENADTNEEGSLDDDQCNRLSRAAVLGESDEQRFNQDVTQTWHNEVVGGGTKLDV